MSMCFSCLIAGIICFIDLTIVLFPRKLSIFLHLFFSRQLFFWRIQIKHTSRADFSVRRTKQYFFSFLSRSYILTVLKCQQCHCIWYLSASFHRSVHRYFIFIWFRSIRRKNKHESKIEIDTATIAHHKLERNPTVLHLIIIFTTYKAAIMFNHTWLGTNLELLTLCRLFTCEPIAAAAICSNYS